MSDTNEVKDTVAATDTASKTKELIAAAKERNKLEQARAEATTANTSLMAEKLTETEKDNLRAGAETLAAANVQSRANTLTGVIDPEAMGDVKGDGGDAKNYDDSDPAKRLGVPVWEHGLGETNTAAPSNDVLLDDRPISPATRAEMDAGRAALEGRSTSSEAEKGFKTTVSDSPAPVEFAGTSTDDDTDTGKASVGKSKK